jgi:hypothetical protein
MLFNRAQDRRFSSSGFRSSRMIDSLTIRWIYGGLNVWTDSSGSHPKQTLRYTDSEFRKRYARA